MAIAVKHRRGTSTEHAAFTGAEGEITVDTSKTVAVVHDGATAGGVPLAREDHVHNLRVTDPFKPGIHSGLNFSYGIGIIRNDNVVTRVAAGSVTLTDNATNYIEVTAAGVVSANTSGYTEGRIPLYAVVTASGAIVSVQDDRSFFNAAAGGGGGFTIGWTLEMIAAGFTETSIDVPA